MKEYKDFKVMLPGDSRTIELPFPIYLPEEENIDCEAILFVAIMHGLKKYVDDKIQEVSANG